MDFFDKKSDVINIELTPEGREALNSGSLKFVYYSFHDTDIIYDSRYMDITQSKFTRVDSIQDQERLKQIPIPISADMFLAKSKSSKIDTEMNHTFVGSSELGNNKYPAFSIKALSGYFTSSLYFETNSKHGQKIPVLTIEMQHDFDVLNKKWINDDFILLEIEELNGLNEKENFSLQFKEIKLDQPLKNKELYFYDNNIEQYISDNIEEIFEDTEIQQDNIEYSFFIEVDNYIKNSIDFLSLPPDKQQQIRDLIYNNEDTTEC